MYFKRIEIQGFKSFAEPVSIDFHEGITCIVGPNGSGKSNISDAIRWVLGEQSAKMLRGGKMEEVIFAGTENRKSRGMAEVTLVINNESHMLPIDYSEVAITRRMYRSGESGYFINKVPCRLRDIRELIMDTGIGVDGYSIIGQGKIADILSDKPEARREIFEEAAGIVKYRSKKEESERKLEASKGNLDRVDDIIGEIESRIDGLREDSIKAREYLKLKERFDEVEINIILKNIENLELKNEYIKDDIAQLQVAMQEESASKNQIDKEVYENEKRNEELDILDTKTRDKLLNIIQEVNDISNKKQINAEKFSSFERDESRIKAEINSFKGRMEKEEVNIVETESSLSKLNDQYETMKKDYDDKAIIVEKLGKDLEDINRVIESHKNDIFESYNITAGKKSEINSLLSLKNALEKRREQLEKEGEAEDLSKSDLKLKHKEESEERDKLKSELEELIKEGKSLADRYNDNLLKEKHLTGEYEEKRLKMGQMAGRHRVLVEMEDAYEGYNEAVKYIMKSKLKGMHGVVADLIRVPKGFERAIETALGAAIQNVVCDKDESAKEAIRLLKVNRVGRLTFLPVSGIRPTKLPAASAFSKEAGFKGLGVDCIEFSDEYKSVMEYLLGRVIIVEKLDDAIRLSKGSGSGGLRFVSLEGDVVNASGAITGGAFRNKTAGLLERKTEAELLFTQLADLKEDIDRSFDQLEQIRANIEKEKTLLESLREKHKDGEMVLIGKENEIARLLVAVSDMDSQKAKRDKELLTITEEEESAEKNISSLKELVGDKEGLISFAEDTVKNAAETKNEKDKELEKQKEELTQIRLLTVAAAGNRDNAVEKLKRIKTHIDELVQEIADREENLTQINSEKELLSNEEDESAVLLIEKDREKIQIEYEIRAISEEKNNIFRYLSEIREKKESLGNIITKMQFDKHEHELKLAKNETQIEGYKEKLWEDLEVSYVQAIDFQKKDFVMSAALKESRDLKSRIKELGEINLGSIKEYDTVKERYDFLSDQRKDLLEAIEALVRIIDDMDNNIKRSFKESFDQVVINFEEIFRSLFGGGLAELRLADESRPLETGIDIIVQPPGKKLQNINLMSGGEKTLTAIALMFAILKTKPTPFCILDEVEAALDEANIDRFAKYLRGFKEIQFTLVTHQKATMEYADVLYGVTMPEGGISKVISLKLGDEIDL